MSIIDTQILSYYYKGVESPQGQELIISSITAAEFLLVQSDKVNKANYYPLLPHGLPMNSTSEGVANLRPLLKFDSKKHAAHGKGRTDEILIDLSGDLPPFIEYGSYALSEIINRKRGGLFTSSIPHLPKTTQKKTEGPLSISFGLRCSMHPLNNRNRRTRIGHLEQVLDYLSSKVKS